MGKYLDATGLSHLISKIKTAFQEKLINGTNIKSINNESLLGSGNISMPYADAPSAGGNANYTNAILYGTVDSTSTATVFTATIEGLDALVDGTCIMLHNGVITSAEGFTLNVNGLGAKPCYNNMTNATRDTTIFNANYTMLFIYNTELDSGSGGWWIYRGYDANTNTIGYQLRTNSSSLVAIEKGYKYRIWLTVADGTKMMPINTSTSTNATTVRSLNTRKFNPFGRIVYRSTNGTCNAGDALGATAIWDQYTLTIGYSYMQSGFSLTFPAPVYIKATPQSDGSAVMDTIVQTLPSTNDGKIYVFLGFAYSATAMELYPAHPVYYHDGTSIRIWTGKTIPTKVSELTNDSGYITNAGVTSFNGSTGAITYTAPVTSVNGSTGAVTVSVPSASTTNPSMDGTASYGSGTDYARANHVHPTDTSRQATLVSGTNIKTVNNESLLGSGDISISFDETSTEIPLDMTQIASGAASYFEELNADNVSLGLSALYDLAQSKANSSHTHSGSDITSGTVGFSYLPTGAGSNQVAIGNHTHSGYAASTHDHGNITNGGDITATAPTVASGDKLIINDESASKVTNGPSFGTSTTTFLANNGTWQTPAGTTYIDFAGGTSSAAGTNGLVPAPPMLGEVPFVLEGSGIWASMDDIIYTTVGEENGFVVVDDSADRVVSVISGNLMTDAQSTKLAGIATGAEVNQNAFSTVKVGSTNVAADAKTDTLELAGSNVTLTPDTTNDKVTIGITASNVTTALGNTAVARASANANGTTFGDAAVKNVDTSISSGSTSTNLPTTAAVVSYIAGMTTDVSMEDTDVDDAVNAAWSGVGISVANGVSF